MFIMIGAGSGHRKKAYLGVRICPHCGKLSHFYLMEQAQQVSLFFVPVVRWGKHWGIACSRCKAGFEIEDTEKAARAEWHQRRQSSKTYLFDHMSEEMQKQMEKIRLGEKE